jgi:hypothetical protein
MSSCGVTLSVSVLGLAVQVLHSGSLELRLACGKLSGDRVKLTHPFIRKSSGVALLTSSVRRCTCCHRHGGCLSRTWLPLTDGGCGHHPMINERRLTKRVGSIYLVLCTQLAPYNRQSVGWTTSSSSTFFSMKALHKDDPSSFMYLRQSSQPFMISGCRTSHSPDLFFHLLHVNGCATCHLLGMEGNGRLDKR